MNSIAVSAVAALGGTTAVAQTASHACNLKNPILAVAPEIYLPGVGHIYIGGGERKRGGALLGAAMGGAVLIVTSQLLGPPSEDFTVRDNITNVGVGITAVSYVFSIVDIVPALVRDRRRCERRDARTGLNVQPIIQRYAVTLHGRLNAGVTIGVRLR